MPVLIILGIFAIYGVASFIDFCKKPAPPRDKTLNEKITNEMIGKSTEECRKILRKYRK